MRGKNLLVKQSILSNCRAANFAARQFFMRLAFQHIHCSADTQTAQRASPERSVQLFDDLNAFFNSERSAVERDVIVFRMPPFHIGV